MPQKIKIFLQYVIILSITGLLVWFSLKGLQGVEGSSKADSWELLSSVWKQSHKGWLFLMAVIAMLSHVIRAQRWRMLIIPSGHKTNFTHAFLSLMIGYFVNLFIPRGGELSRCYNLYKLDKTPVQVSFGTVVTERIVDVVCLLILLVISFTLESEKLFRFIDTLPFSGENLQIRTLAIASIVGIVFMVLVGYLVLRRSKKVKAFVTKTLLGFKEGLLSVFKLRDKKLFLFYSVVIWALYFAMSYAVIKAFPATAMLGGGAVLTLFAIGSIAMAAPLPGGTGSYHVLVPQGLVFLYNMPRQDAVAFTFIFHGWQTLIMILAGALSFLITIIMVGRKKSMQQ